MAWGWVDNLIGDAKKIGQGAIDVGEKIGKEVVNTGEKVGKEIIETGDKVVKGVVKAGDEVVSLPGKIYHEYADDKPQSHSYQGAAGRHHDNATVINGGSASYHDSERQVQLACRLVGGGFAGESLGMMAKIAGDVATHGAKGIPNPAHHWCITVGSYLHQLQATSLDGGWNYYTNEKINPLTGGWTFYPIGSTTYNDAAIRDESTKVMNEMDEVYNAFNNNCQTFSLRLVDRILTSVRQQKFLMANLKYGIQKTPEIDIKTFKKVVVTRIDTGEIVEPEVEPEIEPGNIEQVAVPEPEPLIAEEPSTHGEAVEVANEQSEMPRAQMLCDVALIMIQNTPTVTKEGDEVATKAPALSTILAA